MFILVRNSVIWLMLTLLLPLAACTTKPAVQPAKTQTVRHASVTHKIVANKSAGSIALDTAQRMLGVTYRYGGTDPRGFDCSGLVQYSFKQAGVMLPRTSQEIFQSSRLVSPADMQPGDLVFFRISSSKVSHVGIYAGNRHFIHSPSSGKGVSYASLDNSYWRKRLAGAGRI
jgi:cell wall-associated NlpC family hydrolase